MQKAVIEGANLEAQATGSSGWWWLLLPPLIDHLALRPRGAPLTSFDGATLKHMAMKAATMVLLCAVLMTVSSLRVWRTTRSGEGGGVERKY